jgi:hypothetical protein
MHSNTHSNPPPIRPPGGQPDELAALAAGPDRLAARDLEVLSDAVRAARVLALRGLADRLERAGRKELAVGDGRGAAGAEADLAIGSTAAWLRGRLRMGAGAASSVVWTARALVRGPLAGTAQAVWAGELSRPTPRAWPKTPTTWPPRPNRCWWPPPAAWTHPPPPSRRPLGQLADPDEAEAERERRSAAAGGVAGLDRGRHGRPRRAPGTRSPVSSSRPPWTRWPPRGMPALPGVGSAERRCLGELARRHLQAGSLPKTGGVRPQLAVVVDLNSRRHPGGGRGRWIRRPAAGWPVTGRSPGSWSANPTTTARAATVTVQLASTTPTLARTATDHRRPATCLELTHPDPPHLASAWGPNTPDQRARYLHGAEQPQEHRPRFTEPGTRVGPNSPGEHRAGSLHGGPDTPGP